MANERRTGLDKFFLVTTIVVLAYLLVQWIMGDIRQIPISEYTIKEIGPMIFSFCIGVFTVGLVKDILDE